MSSRNRNRPNDELAHLLTGLWNFTLTDSPVLIRNLLNLRAAATTNGTPASFALTHPGTALSTLDVDATNLIGTTEVTLFIEYEKRDATNRGSGLIGVGAPSSAGILCGVHGPWSDGVVYWDFGGTTSGTTRLAVSSMNFSRGMWAFTAGPRGMEIWKSGLRVASNAATPTRTASTNAYHLGTHNGTSTDFDNYYTCAISKYQLNPATIAEITSDPSKLFARAPARIYTFPTVGAPSFKAAWARGANTVISSVRNS